MHGPAQNYFRRIMHRLLLKYYGKQIYAAYRGRH